MKFLDHQFCEVDAIEPAGLFRLLRADLRAKSIWYYGRCSPMLSLRMLFSDGGLCTALYRCMSAFRRWHLGLLVFFVYKLNAFLTGAVIGRGADFGPGLVILHSVGTVINSSVRAGENTVIEGGVTIGAEKGRSPVLGNRVFVGAGARIIGDVEVGDAAKVGANAVVLDDVPPNATAVGVPARIAGQPPREG